MKKTPLAFVLLLAMACGTVIPYKDEAKVHVASAIPEKHTVRKQSFVQKNLFGYTWLKVNFKDARLKNASFDISVEDTDVWAFQFPECIANTLIDSIITPEYRAKIYRCSSAHPAFSNWEEEFKVIRLSAKRDTMYISAWNESDFKDSITPQFIAQKISELQFTVQPKN